MLPKNAFYGQLTLTSASKGNNKVIYCDSFKIFYSIQTASSRFKPN